MPVTRIITAIAFSVALTGFAQTTTLVIDSFDPSGTGGNSYASGQIGNVWTNWFGDAFRSVSWDPNSDANSNPNSGSMKITAMFDGAGSIPDQFEVFDGFNGIQPPLNGLQYTNFQCDVRFDPNSATVALGGTTVFGHLEFGTRNVYDQDYFGSVDVPASNTNWVHVSIPLNAVADANLTNINDVLIHIYGPYYPTLSGSVTLWVDNIKFVGAAPVPTNCVVNWTDTHQRIDGFGASSAWFGTWTAAQADMFFSTNNGIGLSLLRNRIAPDGTTVETSIMQMAQARGARVWSTTWSPPAAYKDSGTVNGGNFVSAYNQAYANQLANYVLSMKNNYGINLYAISVQNEPNFDTGNYESCIWTGQQFHDFLPYLYNALSNNGVASTKIMIAESAVWSFDLTTASMSDVTTSNMVGVLASHDYDYNVFPVNAAGKPLWETEVSTFESFDGSIGNGLYWAGQIHSFMTVAEANAWNFWWLISANPDNEGLTDTNGNPAKRMYVMGQYSRFVRPGYYRVGVLNNAGTSISAYKDPNSGAFAVVAINNNNSNYVQTFNLNGFTATNVTPWITSGSLSLASQPVVGVTNGTFVYALPAMSVVTFVGKANVSVPTLAIQRNGSQIGLTMNGNAGWNYSLLSSTNLSNWQTLLLTNPTAMPITWNDTNAISNARFYRVRLGQ